MSIVFTLPGAVLFIYFVRKAGVGEIIADIREIGAGFLLVIAISVARPVVRALAWTRCFEPPHRLRFRDAFAAYLMGDAVGNLIPLGIIVSEPAKVALVRKRAPIAESFSAIAIENLFYSLSVALFIFSGAAALLLSFPLPKALRWASVATLASVAVVVAAGYFIIHRECRFLSGALDWLSRRNVGRSAIAARRGRVVALEDRIYGFYSRHRSRFLSIALLEACFHLTGIVEIYVTLLLIGDAAPTLLAAFVLESINRVINVVFKFVPFRVGVDEAGSGLLTGILRLGTASGVTLAIIRKARILVWTTIGALLLVARGLSVKTVAREAEEAAKLKGEDEKRLSKAPSG